jgi:PPOX class probable F420-dependent enzyme
MAPCEARQARATMGIMEDHVMMTIPASHRDLFIGPIVVSLAVTLPDGRVQVNPVWCSLDGGDVLVNTARGRVKDKALRATRRATVLAIDPGNPYRWAEVRGDVVDMTEAGADAHIDDLAELYLGKRPYPFRQPGEVRVICRLRPTRVNVSPA